MIGTHTETYWKGGGNEEGRCNDHAGARCQPVGAKVTSACRHRGFDEFESRIVPRKGGGGGQGDLWGRLEQRVPGGHEHDDEGRQRDPEHMVLHEIHQDGKDAQGIRHRIPHGRGAENSVRALRGAHWPACCGAGQDNHALR